MKRYEVIRMSIILSLFLCVILQSIAQDKVTIPLPDAEMYGFGEWDADSLGNHRVVIRPVNRVEKATDAARVIIPWRRRDFSPEKKAVLFVDAATGKRISNVHPLEINREYGELIFQPKTVPGDIYVYYLSHRTFGRSNYPTVTYWPPVQTANEDWLNKYIDPSHRVDLPLAEVVQFQAINELNSFYPMEIIATQDEIKQIVQTHESEKYVLFPEDRQYPIRMTRDLPARWFQEGVRDLFTGKAQPGEYYAFQVGLFAAGTTIADVDVRFTGLRNPDGQIVVPKSNFTCFNTEGVDWVGESMDPVCSVEHGRVRALWMGVQIPEDLGENSYEGEVIVDPEGLPARSVRLIIDVGGPVLADAGDSEPWRHSRLRWLNSTIAEDDDLVPPFTPIGVNKDKIHCLGRTVQLNKMGLPKKIQSFFAPEMTHIIKKAKEILESDIRFIVQTNNKKLKWKSSGFQISQTGEGKAIWKAVNTSGAITMTISAEMEFDGNLEFQIDLATDSDIDVEDIRLEIPMQNDAAVYMMGMGQKGGFRPDSFDWTWAVDKNQDGIWVGDINGGLQVSFKDTNYVRPLNTNFYQLKPLNMPPSWTNDGKGGFRLRKKGKDTVLLTSFSGPREILKGEKHHFHFRLLITPFKPIDTKAHWHHRYFHRYKTVEYIQAQGANTVNVHHATRINPFINYPFIRPEAMKAYIDSAHALDMKVKIYYTVRELTNIAPELFALFSLGHEVLSSGKGGGFSWLQEHLDQDYIAGWLVPRLKDAAVINSGVSRWHNYYLEGLQWLVQNVGIDGLYIDDVAFDRTVMQRLRKILDRTRPGALIDLHSANQYNPRDGFANSANLYMEHFPYLNRLWFGEYFDYDSKPDFWMTEIAGIPFGLMGEMLWGGGNRWRGMIYGMTSRLPWAGDPRPMWKLWDDFGIQDSRMIGYWVDDCPVKTNREDVLATAYVRDDKTLISLASWADGPVSVRLDINFKTLGLNPKSSVLVAPAINDFQDAAQFNPDETIPVQKGKGWLLIIEEK